MIRGINVNNINDLLIQLINIKENLYMTFNNIQNITDEIKQNYQSESSNIIYNRLVDLNKNSNIIFENFDNYIMDFKTLRENTELFEEKLQMLIIDK